MWMKGETRRLSQLRAHKAFMGLDGRYLRSIEPMNGDVLPSTVNREKHLLEQNRSEFYVSKLPCNNIGTLMYCNGRNVAAS